MSSESVTGFSIVVPDSWYELDLDPVTRDESARRLASERNDGYRAMNGALRSGDLTDPAVAQRIADVRQGLADMPPHTGLTYRGTNLPDEVLQRTLDTGVYDDDAFSSSSTNSRISEGFISQDKANQAFFTIEGVSGVDVRPLSAARGETEVLFDAGSRFQVVDHQMDGEMHRFVLREVAP